VIRIEPTWAFDVKTEHSIWRRSSGRRTYVDHARIRCQSTIKFRDRIKEPARPGATFENYRAQNVFERLSAWLRSKGVTVPKPIHELRKESGSMVNRQHGLTAAKDFLRHADIGITAAHYIDRPRQATSGLGALLKVASGKKVVPLRKSAA
jgi:hypothetical protein